MKYIYRVENKLGHGPYIERRARSVKKHTDTRNRPSPIFDKKIRASLAASFVNFQDWYRGDMLCGFNSLKQLKAWFTKEELSGLNKEGFFVVRIEVKKLKRFIDGDKQVIYSLKRRRKLPAHESLSQLKEDFECFSPYFE